MEAELAAAVGKSEQETSWAVEAGLSSVYFGAEGEVLFLVVFHAVSLLDIRVKVEVLGLAGRQDMGVL